MSSNLRLTEYKKIDYEEDLFYEYFDFSMETEDYYKYRDIPGGCIGGNNLDLRTKGKEILIEDTEYTAIEVGNTDLSSLVDSLKDCKLKEAFIFEVDRHESSWEDTAGIKVKGWRKTTKEENDLLKELRKQIPHVEENQRQVNLDKVREAKAEYDKLRELYGDV